jgi:integrase
MQRRTIEGVVERHSSNCPSLDGGRCNARAARNPCRLVYEPWVWDRRAKKKLRPYKETFRRREDAVRWRREALRSLERGELASTAVTVRQAGEAWIAGATAEPPTILTRGGRPYKPSVLRSFEADLRNYVYPDFGAHRLSDVRRRDVQALVRRVLDLGLSGSKARNVVMPLRAIYREHRDDVPVNPTQGVEFPALGDGRERAASAEQAADLLAALPMPDRALWAAALYGGLRLGELRALRWDDVDLAEGTIRVERSWDVKVGEVAPKSRKGTRTVPILGLLRDVLAELRATSGREGREFVFGAAADRPFTASHLRKRARRAWDAADAERAERGLAPLYRVGFHEARHTCVSLLHAAGIPLERIGDYVGHSSAYMTDRYRHLLEGQRDDDRLLADRFLALADTASRRAQLADAP